MATYNKRGYKAPKPEETKVENEFEEVEAVDVQDSTTAEVFNTLDENFFLFSNFEMLLYFC